MKEAQLAKKFAELNVIAKEIDKLKQKYNKIVLEIDKEVSSIGIKVSLNDKEYASPMKQFRIWCSENIGRMFTRSEIVNETGLPYSTITNYLTRHRDKLVEKINHMSWRVIDPKRMEEE